MEIQNKDTCFGKKKNFILFLYQYYIILYCSKKYLDSNSKAECLTCNETEIIPPVIKPSENSALLTDSQSCLYYSASFSTNGDYYALECLGERIPITYIKKVDEKKIKLKDQEGTQESKSIYHFLKKF